MNAFLFISIGLACGLGASGIVGAYLYRRINLKIDKVLAEGYLMSSYSDLEALRAGKIETVINRNENVLNAGIIGLGRLLRSIPPPRRDSDDVGMLRYAKEYRAKHPRKPGIPEVDTAVKEAFALVD